MQKPLRWIVTRKQLQVILHRIAWETIEKFYPFYKTCMIAIPPNGQEFASRLLEAIGGFVPEILIPMGILKEQSVSWVTVTSNQNSITFKHVLLIDDVLFTGTNIMNAIITLQNNHDNFKEAHFHPVILVNRRGNRKYPVEPVISGITVDIVANEWIKVWWSPKDPHEGISISI